MMKEAAIGVVLYFLFKKKPQAAAPPTTPVIPEGTVSPVEMEAAHAVLAQKIAAGDVQGAAAHADAMEAAGIPVDTAAVVKSAQAAPQSHEGPMAPDYLPGGKSSEVTQIRRGGARAPSVCNTNVNCDDEQYLESFPTTM